MGSRDIAYDFRVPLFFQLLNFCFERFWRVVWFDGDAFLQDNFAGVDAFVNVVKGATGLFFAGFEDFFVDAFSEIAGAAEFWHEGGVDVDYFSWKFSDEFWSEDAHVAN